MSSNYKLSARSLQRLDKVHPNLVRVVKRAIEITTVDFVVQEGLRSLATQKQYVARGVSKTMNSKHLLQKDGYSHAVDVVPYVGGQPRWEWNVIYPMAAAMITAAKELNIKLTWGGVWDRDIDQLPTTAEGIKDAVKAYTDRRRAMGKSAFIDGPHFEIEN